MPESIADSILADRGVPAAPTRILVAESTVELAGDRFEFIRVAELPVRGRRQNIVVYRLIGSHNADETLESQPFE